MYITFELESSIHAADSFCRTMNKCGINTSKLKSVILYGTAAGLLVAYFTNWKSVLKHVPIYNRKYENEAASERAERPAKEMGLTQEVVKEGGSSVPPSGDLDTNADDS